MPTRVHYEGQKLAALSKTLSAAAMGHVKADLVITGGKIVNVHTGEIEQGKDIAIKAGRVVLIGSTSHLRGEDTEIMDATGYYLTPGFMDGHVHVESSMSTVTQFARAVLPRGTTTIFMDPHEIANVLGMEGVKLMVEEGITLPLRVYATMPSCVPAAPGFEDAGAVFGPKEVEEAMEWNEIIGLGEMMNFPGVLFGNPEAHGILAAALKSGKVITGHYSIPDIEVGLQAYAAAGVASCHESTTMEDALARMRLGMYAKLREGSAWHDVKATVKSITENKIDTRYAVLVSDDAHPHTLLSLGHLDHVVRRAIREGVDPITAIQMVTINTAQCFEVDRFMGSLAPGRYADILFIKDLAEVDVEKVMVEGRMVAENHQLQVSLEKYDYPKSATHSVHLKAKLTEDDFIIKAPIEEGTAQVRVMEIIEAHVGINHLVVELPVVARTLEIPADEDILRVMVLERHGINGTSGLGLVKGFGIKEGAVASTVAHDSHNLLIMGANAADMAYAGNVLAEEGGGMVAVKDGEILAMLPLPIAGLMSERPVEEVGELVDQMDAAWKTLGCELVSPFMTMALISLPVLPELRLTNRGLVDTLKFTFTDLFVAK